MKCDLPINMGRLALSMVLLISRVAGVAPFLKRVEYRISLTLVIFARVFILIIAIYFIMTHVESSYLFFPKNETAVMFEIHTTTLHCLLIITIFVSVFNSPERTIRVLRSLKELDQIDKKNLGYLHRYGNEIWLTVLIFIYLHLCMFLQGYTLSNGRTIETACKYLIVIAYYIINLSELIVALFARRTMFSLKAINTSLEQLCKNSQIKDISSQILKTGLKHPILAWEKVKQQSFYTRSKQGWLVRKRLGRNEEPVKLIRQCLLNYLYVCDIIRASTDGDGFFIVILLIRNIILLLTQLYCIIFYAFTTSPDFVNGYICDAIFWCVVCSVSLILFIEPYHRTQSEMQKLQFLLVSLKCTNLDRIDVGNELHLFGIVFNINKPKYSPLRMFTLNKLLEIKVFGSLVTYLVIMVTYGPQLDNILLINQ